MANKTSSDWVLDWEAWVSAGTKAIISAESVLAVLVPVRSPVGQAIMDCMTAEVQVSVAPADRTTTPTAAHRRSSSQARVVDVA